MKLGGCNVFIVLLEYIRPLEEIDLQMEAHVAFLDKYYSSGQFIVSGRQNPRTGGVILVRGTLKNELEELLTQDPFWQHGLVKHTIVEFTPTRHNPEFITV